MTTEPEHCLAELDPRRSGQELSLGTRIDRNGKTTYHVLTSDSKTGIFVEKIYDAEHRLIRIQKRSPGSRCETSFSAQSGEIQRIFESSALSDGNALTKEIVYEGSERSNEAIIVVAPNGELVRRVERDHIGLRTTFQGQTEYNPDGTPATTVNHHMDESTGRLVRREQIQWLHEGQRLLNENFYFDQNGSLQKYTKVLYHATAGPFIEESQFYDGETQTLLKREIAAYDLEGTQTCMDVLTYEEDGEIRERNSRFFDRDGKEIASLSNT